MFTLYFIFLFFIVFYTLYFPILHSSFYLLLTILFTTLDLHSFFYTLCYCSLFILLLLYLSFYYLFFIFITLTSTHYFTRCPPFYFTLYSTAALYPSYSLFLFLLFIFTLHALFHVTPIILCSTIYFIF